MTSSFKKSAIAAMLACALFAVPALPAQNASSLTNDQRSDLKDILRKAAEDVKKNYYDPNLRGLDWDARLKQYSERINSARDMGEGYRAVAAFLGGLKDSHTFFSPPMRPVHYDSGYRYALVGNAAYITQIRPHSDADGKLHIGDKIMGMNGFLVDRGDFQDVGYYFGTLAPQMTMKFDLVSPTGEARQTVVHAAVKQQKKVMDLTQGQDIWELIRRGQTEDHADRSQILERGDVAIWKLNEFDLSSLQINSFIDTARKHQTLILDLRGNPGGFEDTLRTMLGSVFDHEVKIADRITRKEKDNKPVKSSHFASIFKGKLIVLIDSHSASCSELFARVVQLEHRGTVIGDQSAGAVMEAMDYSETMGMDTISLYGFSITHANLIMADGKSLENVGVTPDELMLPTADDLAAGRDPVLSHAADLGGLKLDPVEAGKMFPYEWLPL